MRTLSIVFLFSILFSCTDNQMARRWGGTEEIKLKPCEKFVNLTWKEDQIWLILEDTCNNTYVAREKSSFGLMEGTVVIKK